MTEPLAPDQTEWVSRSEAAKRYGITLRTLDRMVRDGRLNAKKHAFTGRVLVESHTAEDLARAWQVIE